MTARLSAAAVAEAQRRPGGLLVIDGHRARCLAIVVAAPSCGLHGGVHVPALVVVVER